MYAQDLATYCRVLLCTTQMVFIVGLLRIQFILFNQLAGITGNRPEALLMLQYRHLQITLVRDANSDRPNPVIRLSPEFTKSFLGAKDSCVYPIFNCSSSQSLLTFLAIHSISQKLSATQHLL